MSNPTTDPLYLYDAAGDCQIRWVRLRSGQSILGIPRRLGPPGPRYESSAILQAPTWILSGDADELVALLVPFLFLEEALNSSRGKVVRVTRYDAADYRLDLLA